MSEHPNRSRHGRLRPLSRADRLRKHTRNERRGRSQRTREQAPREGRTWKMPAMDLKAKPKKGRASKAVDDALKGR